MEPRINKHISIPNFDFSRQDKHLYAQIPIVKNSEYYNEKICGIYDYGLAGQSYYTRPNDAISEPVKEIHTEPMLRKSVAEKLAYLNNMIKNDSELTSIFGGPVELYIEEGLRSFSTQEMLYKQVFPALLRKQFPGIDSEEVDNKLKDLIAFPSLNEESPSPHSTGAAFDVTLRFHTNESLAYDKNQQEVVLKRFDADVSEANFPDYFENPNNIHNNLDARIRDNRRIFYALMTGKYFGYNTEFACNPTEWWHWSYGDQLWAFVKNLPHAYYSVAI